ncbi:hypothetical protein L596_020305 [Steinernema carpocapsae]|uniref:Uncharacterized protein n=1 Tax=Steinernema carpocapsae TaxID=34508 RepID=A0A4U5MT52_STECR|nr:hypothetical protein L596_020305 [Steinernema carpocapsae]
MDPTLPLYSLLNHPKEAATLKEAKIAFGPKLKEAYLAVVVPHASHDGLTLLIPESDILVGGMAREGVQGLVESLDERTSGPRVASADVHPFVEHDAGSSSLGAHAAFAVGRSSTEVADDDPHVVEGLAGDVLSNAIVREGGVLSLVVDESKEGASGAILPEDGERVAALQHLAVDVIIKAVLVLDPLVPEAEGVVVALVLEHLDHSSEVLRSGELGLQVREGALDDSTVVPGAEIGAGGSVGAGDGAELTGRGWVCRACTTGRRTCSAARGPSRASPGTALQ